MIAIKQNSLFSGVQLSGLIMVLSLSFSPLLQAATLDDVTVPDTVTLEGSDVPLQLNGMGCQHARQCDAQWNRYTPDVERYGLSYKVCF